MTHPVAFHILSAKISVKKSNFSCFHTLLICPTSSGAECFPVLLFSRKKEISLVITASQPWTSFILSCDQDQVTQPCEATRWTWFTILALCFSKLTALLRYKCASLNREPVPLFNLFFTPASHFSIHFASASQVVKLFHEGHIPEMSGTFDNRWSSSLAHMLVHQTASVACHCPRIPLFLPPSFTNPFLHFGVPCLLLSRTEALLH